MRVLFDYKKIPSYLCSYLMDNGYVSMLPEQIVLEICIAVGTIMTSASYMEWMYVIHTELWPDDFM